MQAGLCSISDKERALPSAIEIAADAGFDGVEVWGEHVGDDATDPADARELAAEAGLPIPALGSYLRPGSEAFEAGLPRVLDTAETLGADLVRVWAGNQEYGDHDPEHWDAVVEDLRTCADAAADRDLDITVEKHAWTLAYTGEACLELVEAVDRENVGINWDPGIDADEDIDEALDALAPVVNHVHVSGEEPAGEEAPLEAAYPDFEDWIDRLDAAGFDGFVDMEFVPEGMDYETAVRRDAAFMTEVVR